MLGINGRGALSKGQTFNAWAVGPIAVCVRSKARTRRKVKLRIDGTARSCRCWVQSQWSGGQRTEQPTAISEPHCISADGRTLDTHHRINEAVPIVGIPSPAQSSPVLRVSKTDSGRSCLVNDDFRQNLSRRKAAVARTGSPCHGRSQRRREGLGRQGRHRGQVSKGWSRFTWHG